MDKKHSIPHTAAENTAIELFGLSHCDVEQISTQFIPHAPALIHITLAPDYPQCPRCHYEKPNISRYVDKTIQHSILSTNNCLIHYRARRYKCPICGKTYYERNPFVFKNDKISYMTVMSILEDLYEPSKTFSSVARDYHVSATTVQNLFDGHVDVPKARHLPRVMQIDETYSFKSQNSSYVCMILDYDTQKAVFFLPTRKKEDLMKFFRSFPKTEREKVKYIAADMYKTYHEVCKSMFPHAIYAVDRFHVMQEFMKRYTAVRVRIMKGKERNSDDYYLLKHQFKLLDLPLKAKDGQKPRGSRSSKPDNRSLVFDPAAEKIYNSHFKCYLNRYDLRELILSVDPQINEIYDFRNQMSEFFRSTSQEEAPQRLIEIIEQMNASEIQDMNQFAETLIRWYPEILNSFSIIKSDYEASNKDGTVRRKDYRLNSSTIENRNKIVKMVKNNANGYTNWRRFRNRVLYVLNKVPYNLEPVERN